MLWDLNFFRVTKQNKVSSAVNIARIREMHIKFYMGNPKGWFYVEDLNIDGIITIIIEWIFEIKLWR
jgi:hypothetical protein